MTEPKFKIGDIVYVPDSSYKLCYQVLARMWDETFGEWMYLGSGERMIYSESCLDGPGDIVGVVKRPN